MAEPHAVLLASIRTDVVDRLVELRGNIDRAYAGVPERLIREQFDLILGKMEVYLRTGDAESYRTFARRWMAMQVGEGFEPESLLHSFTALGDAVVRVAQARMGAAPECREFVREVVRVTYLGTQIMVDIVAEELARRSVDLAALGPGATQPGGRQTE